MNNYEKHYKAQLLSDSNSKYSLAKRIVELEEQLNSFIVVGEVTANVGCDCPEYYVALDEEHLHYLEDNESVYIKVDSNTDDH